MTTSIPFLSGALSRRFRSFLFSVLILFVGLGGIGSSLLATAATEPKANIPEMHATAAPEKKAESAEAKEEGLPQISPVLWDFGYFKINSSMVLMWSVALILIVSAQIATRNIKEVPEGAQNFWEWLVESLYKFLENLIGRPLLRKTFWFFASIFIFIVTLNWFSLIPGVGSVGWGPAHEPGTPFHILHPILRGPNADLNMTLAMSMVFFACWIFWALQANGFGGFLLHLFGPKGETKGFMKIVMVFVFLCVGCLEVVSILFRPVSLSFRLYGNIFAGENTLETMATLGGPWFGWLLTLPFYFMELLVGFVQALVFMLLTAVFTLLIMPHEESHHH